MASASRVAYSRAGPATWPRAMPIPAWRSRSSSGTRARGSKICVATRGGGRRRIPKDTVEHASWRDRSESTNLEFRLQDSSIRGVVRCVPVRIRLRTDGQRGEIVDVALKVACAQEKADRIVALDEGQAAHLSLDAPLSSAEHRRQSAGAEVKDGDAEALLGIEDQGQLRQARLRAARKNDAETSTLAAFDGIRTEIASADFQPIVDDPGM